MATTTIYIVTGYDNEFIGAFSRRRDAEAVASQVAGGNIEEHEIDALVGATVGDVHEIRLHAVHGFEASPRPYQDLRRPDLADAWIETDGEPWAIGVATNREEARRLAEAERQKYAESATIADPLPRGED